MSSVLVDSNVLIDIATNDAAWVGWSADAVEQAAASSRLVINLIIYSEVSVRYSRQDELDAVLPASVFHREPIPWEAAFLAGKVFLDYRRRGGEKRSPLPDFYIGAHAAVAGYRLLTRDVARYRTDFPSVGLICPD